MSYFIFVILGVGLFTSRIYKGEYSLKHIGYHLLWDFRLAILMSFIMLNTLIFISTLNVIAGHSVDLLVRFSHWSIFLAILYLPTMALFILMFQSCFTEDPTLRWVKKRNLSR